MRCEYKRYARWSLKIGYRGWYSFNSIICDHQQTTSKIKRKTHQFRSNYRLVKLNLYRIKLGSMIAFLQREEASFQHNLSNLEPHQQPDQKFRPSTAVSSLQLLVIDLQNQRISPFLPSSPTQSGIKRIKKVQRTHTATRQLHRVQSQLQLH